MLQPVPEVLVGVAVGILVGVGVTPLVGVAVGVFVGVGVGLDVPFNPMKAIAYASIPASGRTCPAPAMLTPSTGASVPVPP